MTISPIIEEKEYPTLPLSASASDPDVVSYGDHPIVLDETSEFDIPSLIPQLVEDDLPGAEAFEKWGRKNRSENHEGVWHHYSADSKFETLLRDPNKLIDTGAIASVEVNVSTSAYDPFPVAIAGLWRKRCVSRIWQDAGLSVFVDVNVEGVARDLVFVGVPNDHCLYATKYQLNNIDGDPVGIDGLYDDWRIVRAHVTPLLDPLFVVYGGGKQIEDICNQEGWLYVPPAASKSRSESLEVDPGVN